MRRFRCVVCLWMAACGAVLGNLLENGGFEAPANLTDWCVTWGTFTVNSEGHPPEGSSAGYIQGASSGQGENGGCIQRVTAQPGRRYEVSGLFHADEAWGAAAKAFKLEFFDKDHNLLEAHTNALKGLVEGKWYLQTISATSPGKTDHLQVVIEASAVSADGALGFDDVSLEVRPER